MGSRPRPEGMRTPREAVLSRLTDVGLGGRPAEAGTIEILRERIAGEQAMLAVEYQDIEGRAWRGVFGAELELGGWRSRGGAGSSGEEPARDRPWANLGGWGWPRFLCAGGWVQGPVHKITMRDRKGTLIEDTLENGIAMLMTTSRFELPATIELFGEDGEMVATHSWGRAAAAA